MKLGRRGGGALKVAHLVCTALWVGGVIALFPLALRVDPADPTTAETIYLNLRAIAWNVVGWGGIGSFATGIALGVLTPWGLFRERWTIAKLGLTLYGIGFGMFFVERHMLAGLAILESATGSSDAFAYHHAWFINGLFAQTTTFAAILLVAVFKPRLGKPARKGALPAAPVPEEAPR